ncbi:glycosyltransferase [Thermodesulfobacteriota bacterium]
MKLLLFEPQLRSNGSHYLNYAVDIGKAAEKSGIRTMVFTDSAIEHDALQTLKRSNIKVLSVFPSSMISRIRIRAIIWPVMAFFYAWTIIKYSRNISGCHIICTVSGTLEYLSGISLAILVGAFRCKILVQMYSWETREHTSATPNLIRFYRIITERLVKKAIDKGNLLLGGQGREVAEHITKHLNRTVPSLPFAIDWSKYKKNGSTNSPLQIGFLGIMRAEKGFRQFVEAVENLKANVDIIIQAKVPEALGESDVPELIERLKRNHRCQILKGELSIREYRKVISKIDIAILPYRPSNFSTKTSNIFSESVGLGKLIVAPKATLMGKILETMNTGISYSPYTSKALQDAIDTAVSNFDELHHRARKKANSWRDENSAESFIKHILLYAGSAPV